ncbi:hypothetical protein LPJ61_002452 [Coemansia biformis]|uniref:Translational machinery component n=1 Tax=Coemansia biformis TaxID=1286918 RepID=A0A9W8CZ60_9FUNG|nr:hypothetical protein LPJ61_002452 [Coemansia biformis]
MAGARLYSSADGPEDGNPPGAAPEDGGSTARNSPAAKHDKDRLAHGSLISMLDSLDPKNARSRPAEPRGNTRYRNLLGNDSLMKGDYIGISGTGRYGGSVDAASRQEEANPMNKLILHVHASSNNTILSLTDAKGQIIVNASGGTVGFKKAQRAGFEAAYQATASIANTVKERGIDVRKIEIKLKGFGAGREAAFKAVNSLTDWVVCAVTDVTPIPFNGCRPKKARRL